jgi:hypothetical protein
MAQSPPPPTDKYREKRIVKFNENMHALKLDGDVRPRPIATVDEATGEQLAPQLTERAKREMLSKQVGRAASQLSGADLDAIKFVAWQDLPECPIHGMRLTERGIYDTDVGRFYEADEVRDLINRTGKLEAVTSQAAENRLMGTNLQSLWDRAFMYWRFWIPIMVAYFWGLKVPQSYAMAFPRRSLLMRWYYENPRFFKPPKTTEEIETLCQRHRALLSMTTTRTLFFGFCGAAIACFGLLGEYVKNIPNQYNAVTKATIHHNQHYEATMKWLFAVYYHHPAYSAASSQRASRKVEILQNTPRLPPTKGPTPNLDMRRSKFEEQFPNR